MASAVGCTQLGEEDAEQEPSMTQLAEGPARVQVGVLSLQLKPEDLGTDLPLMVDDNDPGPSYFFAGRGALGVGADSSHGIAAAITVDGGKERGVEECELELPWLAVPGPNISGQHLLLRVQRNATSGMYEFEAHDLRIAGRETGSVRTPGGANGGASEKLEMLRPGEPRWVALRYGSVVQLVTGEYPRFTLTAAGGGADRVTNMRAGEVEASSESSEEDSLPPPPPRSSEYHLKVLLPKEQVGAFMGEKGAVINHIRKAGATLDIAVGCDARPTPHSVTPFGIALLTSPYPGDVAAGADRVVVALASERGSGRLLEQVAMRLAYPVRGLLALDSGRPDALAKAHHCQVALAPALHGVPERLLTLQGAPDGVRAALAALLADLKPEHWDRQSDPRGEAGGSARGGGGEPSHAAKPPSRPRGKKRKRGHDDPMQPSKRGELKGRRGRQL